VKWVFKPRELQSLFALTRKEGSKEEGLELARLSSTSFFSGEALLSFLLQLDGLEDQ
jgi:hypothetical protein